MTHESDTPTDSDRDVSRRDLLNSVSLGIALAPGLGRSAERGALAGDRSRIDSLEPPGRTSSPSVDDSSVRAIASDCLSLDSPVAVRKDLFWRLGEFSDGRSLRDQMTEIPERHCDFALPPKYVPHHPRLAPIPAIHFDHYNSSVTDLAGLESGRVEARLERDGLLGMCLNFLLDEDGTLYAFCGDLELDDATIKVRFVARLFDERLDTVDEYEITRFSRRRLKGCTPPPLNLGYFVMDDRGRMIVVTNDTDVEFLQRSGTKTIEAVETWHLATQLEAKLPDRSPTAVAEQTMAQVLPSYDRGYWIMALGDPDEDIPAYLGRVSDGGTVVDVHVFRGETIANGMAVDDSGVYVLTDHKLYKATRGADGQVVIESDSEWPQSYTRSKTVKPGTGYLSRRGSGATPTLFGDNDDLVAITDNAEKRVNVRIFDRETGGQICKQPVFERGASANENTLVGYGDSIVVQNWYGAGCYDEEMMGVEPGLTRIDVREDRSGCTVKWTGRDRDREFASTPTVRLSTRMGLLYAPIQVAEGDEYEMAFLDFQTGKFVGTVPFPGSGKGYRVHHSPPYIVPGGRLVQPVRRGYVTFEN